jgi:hypothetical protein
MLSVLTISPGAIMLIAAKPAEKLLRALNPEEAARARSTQKLVRR